MAGQNSECLPNFLQQQANCNPNRQLQRPQTTTTGNCFDKSNINTIRNVNTRRGDFLNTTDNHNILPPNRTRSNSYGPSPSRTRVLPGSYPTSTQYQQPYNDNNNTNYGYDDYDSSATSIQQPRGRGTYIVEPNPDYPLACPRKRFSLTDFAFNRDNQCDMQANYMGQEMPFSDFPADEYRNDDDEMLACSELNLQNNYDADCDLGEDMYCPYDPYANNGIANNAPQQNCADESISQYEQPGACYVEPQNNNALIFKAPRIVPPQPNRAGRFGGDRNPYNECREQQSRRNRGPSRDQSCPEECPPEIRPTRCGPTPQRYSNNLLPECSDQPPVRNKERARDQCPQECPPEKQTQHRQKYNNCNSECPEPAPMRNNGSGRNQLCPEQFAPEMQAPARAAPSHHRYNNCNPECPEPPPMRNNGPARNQLCPEECPAEIQAPPRAAPACPRNNNYNPECPEPAPMRNNGSARNQLCSEEYPETPRRAPTSQRYNYSHECPPSNEPPLRMHRPCQEECQKAQGGPLYSSTPLTNTRQNNNNNDSICCLHRRASDTGGRGRSPDCRGSPTSSRGRNSNCSEMEMQAPMARPRVNRGSFSAERPARTENDGFSSPQCRERVPQREESPKQQISPHAEKIMENQLKELVKDTYCPGVIQDTINGCQDINKLAFQLCFGDVGCLPDVITDIEPLSLIKSFLLRIVSERVEMQKQNSEPKRLTAEMVDDHFSKLYKTDVNKAIYSYLKADILSSLEEEKPSTTFDVDIAKGETFCPVHATVFTCITTPK